MLSDKRVRISSPFLTDTSPIPDTNPYQNRDEQLLIIRENQVWIPVQAHLFPTQTLLLHPTPPAVTSRSSGTCLPVCPAIIANSLWGILDGIFSPALIW